MNASTHGSIRALRHLARGVVVATLTLATLTQIVACADSDPIIHAVGPYSDVHILTDTRNLMPVAEALRKELQTPVEYSLQPEKTLNVMIFDAKEKKGAKVAKNIIVLGMVNGKDRASQEISRHLEGESLRGLSAKDLFVAEREDIYFKNQNVIFLAGFDRNMMQAAIMKKAPALRGQIEIKNRQRVRDFLFSFGHDVDLEQQIQRDAGFVLGVPADYKVTRFAKGDNRGVVEIAATGPTRTLAVMWQQVDNPNVLADQPFLLEQRRAWGKEFLDEDLSEAGGFEWTLEDFRGDTVPKLAGFWEGDTYGGPFRTIFLYDPHRRRLFGLNMLCYAPNMDKHPYMRETHALAETFRLRP